MAQIFVMGRVEDDLVTKTSQSDSAYVCFRLTEQVGKGRTQSYQIWAWNEDVTRLNKLGVRKGKMLWLTGTQELVDSTTDQGKTKTKILKIYLTNFGYIPGHYSSERHTVIPNDPETTEAAPPPEVLDGSREPLPK